jgi:hypothetical protein
MNNEEKVYALVRNFCLGVKRAEGLELPFLRDHPFIVDYTWFVDVDTVDENLAVYLGHADGEKTLAAPATFPFVTPCRPRQEDISQSHLDEIVEYLWAGVDEIREKLGHQKASGHAS